MTFNLSIVTFIILFTLFSDDPKDLYWTGVGSMIPYYLAWTVSSAFFVYILPGLLDTSNKIPLYHILASGGYLIVSFAYPIILVTALSDKKEEVFDS